jgi:two-component system, OmpR family, sensor kinase
MHLPEVLAALENRNGPLPDNLTRVLTCAAPEGVSAPLIAALAAKKLNDHPDDIRAVWQQRPPSGSQSVQIINVNAMGSQKSRGDVSAEFDRTLNEADVAFASALVDLPAFTLAERQANGCWLVVGPSLKLVNTWRLRIFGAFMSCALLLSPIAWWMTRVMSRPLKQLSQRATKADFDDSNIMPTFLLAREIRVAYLAIGTMQKRLRDEADDTTRMLAAVAHDLRTPLTGLRLRAEMAQGDRAEGMIADIDRMTAMIDQFLDFSKGQLCFDTHRYFDLAVVVGECVIDMQALDGHVELRGSSLSSLMVYADELGMRRALTNLIGNAVRYADMARVELSIKSNCISLIVDDDGPGIPRDQIERLQKPFQRLESSRSRQTGGVGLGLTVVRTVVVRHGGRFTLSNREEGGLRAHIELPFALISA